ncbi:DNA replication/repair protein RecF [Shouchella shacheensis]|uniref:DNA replication/repair protein RecF n=1 Tax=Shouchella shacheensis TaxID=1649580 RepID=UPI00073FF39D|nr:DNA replication/repair protein RecF [Shouchella shacheensis]
MIIHTLSLRSFRNYEQLSLTFGSKVNVFIGENAQGKTNVLEAIYVLALAKSHRTAKDKELIQFQAPFAHISATASRRNGDVEVSLALSSKGKKGKVNGLEQRRLSDYVGTLNVVMFAPEDLNLVKGGPHVRRRFIDMELGQISPLYLHHLSLYHKVLKQRNVLLKELQAKKGTPAMLDVLTDQLIEHGAVISQKRVTFIVKLQGFAAPIHEAISRGRETLGLLYSPSVEVSEGTDVSKIKEDLYSAYERRKEQEIRRGTTLFGPHRDDLAFIVNDRDVQTYGSQGQQRTTALSVKLAEIDLIHTEVGEYPVLLLDDVLSELDDYRQSHLLETIQNKVQTFVTTTSTSGLHKNVLGAALVFSVEDGTVTNVSEKPR